MTPKRFKQTLLCGLMLSAGADAAEIYAKPQAIMTGESNDNVALTDKGKTSILGGKLSAGGQLGMRSDLWNVSGDALLSSSKFDETGYNSDDQNVGLKAAYEGEIHEFNAELRNIRDSTRDSELLASGNIGLSASRRDYYSASASWEAKITEKQFLQASVSADSTHYSNDQLSEFDSRDYQLLWGYSLSQRLLVYGGPYRTEVEYPGKTFAYNFIGVPAKRSLDYDSSVVTNGAMTKIIFAFSERDNVDITLGRGRSTNTNLNLGELGVDYFPFNGQLFFITPPRENDTSVNVTRLDARYKWDRENLTGSVTAAQNTQGTSDGYVVEYKQVMADARYYFSPRLYLAGDLTYRTQERLGGSITIGDRDVTVAQISMGYGFSEEWWGSLSYSRTNEEENPAVGSSTESTGNAMYLSLTYSPTETSWGW